MSIKGMLKRISKQAVTAFVVSITLCSFVVAISIINRTHVERLEMEQLIMEKSAKIVDVISKLLYKTQALSSLVVQGNGKVENFHRVAATIIDDPAILNILIAPDGIVSDVYPLSGNEAVIGLDFFSEGKGNKEALRARETGELVFGGPFELVQGGESLVGRLPVYLTDGNDRKFWGLVSVTLKYPQALDGAELLTLEKQGYAYEIWRISPDTEQRQVIASSENDSHKNSRFIEKNIHILNASWYFRVSPVRMWYEYPESWMLIFAGLFISLLITYLAQNNTELKLVKNEIERIAQQDPLTGIFNRRSFMEFSAKYFDSSAETDGCFVIIFDIDRFKGINDAYGHLVGDAVLRGITERISSIIRASDTFARYGGEEFILMITNINDEAVFTLAERMRQAISLKPFEIDGAEINVTASFGIARAEGTLESSISKADVALYKAKEEGRNKTVFK